MDMSNPVQNCHIIFGKGRTEKRKVYMAAHYPPCCTLFREKGKGMEKWRKEEERK